VEDFVDAAGERAPCRRGQAEALLGNVPGDDGGARCLALATRAR